MAQTLFQTARISRKTQCHLHGTAQGFFPLETSGLEEALEHQAESPPNKTEPVQDYFSRITQCRFVWLHLVVQDRRKELGALSQADAM